MLVVVTNRVSGESIEIGCVRPFVSTLTFEPPDPLPRILRVYTGHGRRD